MSCGECGLDNMTGNVVGPDVAVDFCAVNSYKTRKRDNKEL